MMPLMRTPRCLSAPPGLGSTPGARRRSQPRAAAAPSTHRPPGPSQDPDEEVRGPGAGGSGNGGGSGSGSNGGGDGGGNQQVAPAAPVRMESITVALSLQKLFILGFSLLAVGMSSLWAVLGYRLQPNEKAVRDLQAGMEKGHTELKQELRDLQAGVEKGHTELKQELREVRVGMREVELVTAGMAGALACAVLCYLAGR